MADGRSRRSEPPSLHGTRMHHRRIAILIGTVLGTALRALLVGPTAARPAVVRLLADTQPSADIRHVRALSKVHISLPKQAHDLLGTASLLHLRTLSSPNRGTRMLSQDLGQDLGRGSHPEDARCLPGKQKALPSRQGGSNSLSRGDREDSPVGSETPRQPREARRLSKVSRGDSRRHLPYDLAL